MSSSKTHTLQDTKVEILRYDTTGHFDKMSMYYFEVSLINSNGDCVSLQIFDMADIVEGEISSDYERTREAAIDFATSITKLMRIQKPIMYEMVHVPNPSFRKERCLDTDIEEEKSSNIIPLIPLEDIYTQDDEKKTRPLPAPAVVKKSGRFFGPYIK